LSDLYETHRTWWLAVSTRIFVVLYYNGLCVQ